MCRKRKGCVLNVYTHTQLQTEILKKKNGLRAENEKNNKQIHVGFLDILCICEIIATYLIVTRRDISATRLPWYAYNTRTYGYNNVAWAGWWRREWYVHCDCITLDAIYMENGH